MFLPSKGAKRGKRVLGGAVQNNSEMVKKIWRDYAGLCETTRDPPSFDYGAASPRFVVQAGWISDFKGRGANCS